MASSWRKVRLGDLVSIEHGWSFKGDLFADQLTGLPIVVNIGNFQYTGGFRFESTLLREYRGPYPKEYELAPGEILLVMTCQTSGGEILGVPARIPDDGRVYLHNQRMGRVVLKDERADAGYLYYVFLSPAFNSELAITASGSKILHTSPTRIEAFEFMFPSLAEQRAIARVLGALDDKIELNRRMNETLEAMAQAIFQSWFVDFDPVRAKAVGRQPVAIDAATAALFPDSFEESAVRQIPREWRIRPLDAVASFLNGLALQKYPPDSDASLPVIKITELRSGVTPSSGRASASIPADYVVDDGDVLFSWSGSLEVVIWCGGRGALNQHLFKVTSAEYPKWFYYFWVKRHLPEFRAIASDKATTMGHIRRHHLAEAKVVVPSPKVVSAADRVLAPLLVQIILNNQQSRSLAAIRDALLPKLMSGEVRVGEAARVAGGAG